MAFVIGVWETIISETGVLEIENAESTDAEKRVIVCYMEKGQETQITSHLRTDGEPKKTVALKERQRVPDNGNTTEGDSNNQSVTHETFQEYETKTIALRSIPVVLKKRQQKNIGELFPRRR